MCVSILSSFPLSEIDHTMISRQLRHQQLQNCPTLFGNGTDASLEGLCHCVRMYYTHGHGIRYIKAQGG